MTNLGRSHEQTFNEALASALRDTRVDWREKHESLLVEKTGLLPSNQRADILVMDGSSPPIAIETSYHSRDADKDAVRRIGTSVSQLLEIQTAVSVHIPDQFRQYDFKKTEHELSGETNLRYALYQTTCSSDGNNISRTPSTSYIRGTVRDLAQVLRTGATSHYAVAKQASAIAELIEKASEILEHSIPPHQQKQIATAVNQKSFLTGMRTTMVLWLNALLTQQRLAMQNVCGIPSLDFSDEKPTVFAQVMVWRSVLRKNWLDIFSPAIDTLRDCGNMSPSETSTALRLLTRAAELIETSKLGLHLNIGAELFPKLSDDRKESAAFYTQPSIAELLAALTIRSDDLTQEEWESSKLFENRKIADMACGTGTLLRAGFLRTQMFHELAGGDRNSSERVHREAMVNGLIGTDISPIASHLTMSSLAALGYGETFGTTQIGWVGVGDGPGWTGSLEYLIGNQVTDLMATVTGASTGRHQFQESTHRRPSRSITIDDDSIDWILMNPPYSRTRGGQSAFDVRDLTDVQRKATQQRWKSIVDGSPGSFLDLEGPPPGVKKPIPADRRAGMAASFVVLGAKKVKCGGRMGFVLPLSAAFADSWQKTRQFIEDEFEDIVAVTVESGKAIGVNALSADTGMNEMLLVARRRIHNRKSSIVRCVTLTESPMQCGIATEIAKSVIAATKKVSDRQPTAVVSMGEEIGQCVAFKIDRGKPWSPLGVVHEHLAVTAENMKRGRISGDLDPATGIRIPTTTIGELFDVGPTHDLIGHLVGRDRRGAFEFHELRDRADELGPHRSLWRADAKTQTRLLVRPTHKGYVATEDDGLIKRIAESASTLFYSRNMRWTSQALLSASTSSRTLGGRSWVSLSHPDERKNQCFALWINSTLGLIFHWTQAQRTQPGRASTQIGAIKNVPCADFSSLTDAGLDFGSKQFKQLANSKLLPACQAHADPVRKKIDRAVLRLLGIEAEEIHLNELRLMWCSEPSVHGHNRTALRLLARSSSE